MVKKSVGLREFNILLDRHVAGVGEELQKTVRPVMHKTFVQLVMPTPVGNPSRWQRPNSAPEGYVGGTARANWQVTATAPATAILARVDQAGGPTVSEGISKIDSIKNPYIQIWMSNNVPYIERLEDGHSTQAPTGWFKVAVENAIAAFKR